MYLSRVFLDTQNRRTLQALDSPEILHGMVESCFDGERQRCLWRLDELKGQTALLLLSREKPELQRLAKQIGLPESAIETKDYDTLLSKIQNGTVWNFRLTANPVTHVPNAQGGRGKIKAITIAVHQREWLMRQAKKNGFLIDPNQFDVIRSEWRIFRNKGRNLSILCAAFEGVLTVTDQELFTKALERGVGRSKAYGMGLLTIISHG